ARSLAYGPTCRAGRRRGHPLAVPLLCRAPAIPQVPEDDEATEDGAPSTDRRGLRAVLPWHADRDADGAAVVATDSLRHDRVASLDGTTPGRRVRQRRPEGCVRRPLPRLLPGVRANQDDRSPRVHDRRLP